MNQFLSFRLDEEDYAVDILRVQEIKCWDTPTRLPGTPAYVRGVINLRGEIVPLLCVRQRFGLPTMENVQQAVIIVVRTSEGRTVGLVVDAVHDVHTLASEEIQPPPRLGVMGEADFLLGLAAVGDKMLILLDVDLMISQEISALVG